MSPAWGAPTTGLSERLPGLPASAFSAIEFGLRPRIAIAVPVPSGAAPTTNPTIPTTSRALLLSGWFQRPSKDTEAKGAPLDAPAPNHPVLTRSEPLSQTLAVDRAALAGNGQERLAEVRVCKLKLCAECGS